MGLLDAIKSLLGMDGSDTDRDRGETTVPVERDVDAEAEAEPVATEATAAASTEALVDESATGAEAAEPAEAAGPESEDVDTDPVIEEAEPDRDEGTEPDRDDETEPDRDDETAESVEVVKGIGPAYAERLREAGVETVADLREADVAELAAATDLSEKRISRWVTRANDR